MSKSSIWYVYIIETENGHLYTGITTDLERRFFEHRSRVKGARFFHTSPAKAIVFSETHTNRSSASRREAAIKKLKRQEKLILIQNNTSCV